MHVFSTLVNIPGFCLGAVACCILGFVNKTRALSTFLLLILLFGFTLASLQTILINTGYIYTVPHFFRAFSPVYYLMIPTAYLYVRVTLNDEKHFRRVDIFHLLPAILHLIELIPWYMHNTAYKRAWLSKSLLDPDFVLQLREGLLPPYAHNLIRSVLALAYLTAIIQLWVKRSDAKEKICKAMHFASFLPPALIFSLMAFLTLYLTATLLLPPNAIGGINMITGILGNTVVAINLFLFCKPQLLYGLFELQYFPARISAKETATGSSPGSDDQIEQIKQAERDNNFSGVADLEKLYQAKLENIVWTKPYLKHGYSLIDLSRDTGIPRHYLSALLNNAYGLRFNDFINRYRIQYISEHLLDPAWSHLTIEAIAKEGGFNSRTTFFYAIKKFTGLSPKQFLVNARKKA